jgi:hypothetical protein
MIVGSHPDGRKRHRPDSSVALAGMTQAIACIWTFKVSVPLESILVRGGHKLGHPSLFPRGIFYQMIILQMIILQMIILTCVFVYWNQTRRPLFAPCKCSGSIGLTHQECLMSWLEVTRGDGK